MLSPSEIENIPTMAVAPMSRAAAHLELFRSGVNDYLDVIAAAPDAFTRDGVIANARVFIETYSRAPPSAPRSPPASDERCTAIRNGGKQCTRRRKDNTTFCGTHVRCSAPSSSCVVSSAGPEHVAKVCKESPMGTERALRAVSSSSGIPHFMDASGSSWCAEDVCSGHSNPRPVSGS